MKNFAGNFFVAVIMFVLTGQPLFSQLPMVGSENLLDKLRLNKGINGIESVLYSSINGNPYIFKDFHKGKLILNTDEKLDTEIRYDMYADEIHLKDHDVLYALIHPEKVKKIEVDSLTFIYSAYVKSSGDESSEDSSYFIVIADGKCKLLVKKNIRIQDAEPPKLYVDAKPAKFISTKDTYYLKLSNKSAIRIRKEKELLSVLADKKEELSSFISSNKLEISDIKDLVKIITYYNSH